MVPRFPVAPNYRDEIANNEVDQLIARFSDRRGRFGIMACREVDNPEFLAKRLLDAAKDKQGFIIVFTDADMKDMLRWKAAGDDAAIQKLLRAKYRELLR